MQVRSLSAKNRNRVALVLAILITLLVAGVAWQQPFDLHRIEDVIQSAGWWGPVVFIGLYIAGALAFVPGSIMAVAGGLLFGPLSGTLYSLAGAIAGATLSFLIARYLAADWIGERLSGRLKDVVSRVEASGWRFVALIRLVPLLPFAVVNYSLGLMQLRLSHYVLASFVCMIPGTFAYNYLGYAGQQAIGGGDFVLYKLLIGLGILGILMAIPVVIQGSRKRVTAPEAVKSAS
jgi:uncharacterized membrane protein YdjX (TVP38/TMEM64 family)